MSTQLKKPLGDAELAWRKGFTFDRHETAGIYKRKASLSRFHFLWTRLISRGHHHVQISIEIDTAPWTDFNEALLDGASDTQVTRYSNAADDGRYSVRYRSALD